MALDKGKLSVTACLILGGANTLQADEAKALELFVPDITIVVNNVGIYRPGPVEHWVTFHIEKMPKWLDKRRKAGLAEPKQIWTAHHRDVPKSLTGVKPVENWRGSSGLLAVTVGLSLGYDRIVLAGVPMTAEAAHFDDLKPWGECNIYRSHWEKKLPVLKDTVRSMSGWTMKLLGAPTKEWLDGDERSNSDIRRAQVR